MSDVQFVVVQKDGLVFFPNPCVRHSFHSSYGFQFHIHRTGVHTA